MIKRNFALVAALTVLPLAAQSSNPAVDQLLDKIVARERSFLETIQTRTPLIEVYIQETPQGAGIDDDHPTKDHYFLGRFRLATPIRYDTLIERTDPPPPEPVRRKRKKSKEPEVRPFAFLPRGFVQMTVMDLYDFNRKTYKFEYVRREFLGDVRCLVFDVSPVNPQDPGRFVGRIWVEDQDDAIVRFNGTYVNAPATEGGVVDKFFHFDSWRVNVSGPEWVPAQIYVEEEGVPSAIPGSSIPRFKAQVRIWDYAPRTVNKLDELTNILVESKSNVKDEPSSKDRSPIESQRLWERQAEDNVLARMQKVGLLAPPGPVDEVLNTVVNNLIVSANLNIDVRCRVLLTTPLETFAVGHTIVISRGLIDVLPDETSLALMLADELSHIVLGFRAQTQFAFTDQTMVDDAGLLLRFRFQRSREQTAASAKKTVEIIAASPYKNTANAGLFLKELSRRGPLLTRLLQPNLGDQVANADEISSRLASFAASAPALEDNKLEQIAALPLGSRIKLNPWDNNIELVKTRPLSLLSPREKIPFEVTPIALYLTRPEPLNAAKK